MCCIQVCQQALQVQAIHALLGQGAELLRCVYELCCGTGAQVGDQQCYQLGQQLLGALIYDASNRGTHTCTQQAVSR
jgi:hypothetical protein